MRDTYYSSSGPLDACGCAGCASLEAKRPASVTWRGWSVAVVLAVVGLVCVLLGAGGCAALADFFSTPEGQAAGGQAAKGLVGVATNPVNPWAWYELLAGGLAVAGGCFGGKKLNDVRKRRKAAKPA